MRRRSALPTRLASNSLPNKPLVDLHGEAMIVAVWLCAMEADVAPVWVATDASAIADAVRAVGGNAVMRRQDHQPPRAGGLAPGRRAA